MACGAAISKGRRAGLNADCGEGSAPRFTRSQLRWASILVPGLALRDLRTRLVVTVFQALRARNDIYSTTLQQFMCDVAHLLIAAWLSSCIPLQTQVCEAPGSCIL